MSKKSDHYHLLETQRWAVEEFGPRIEAAKEAEEKRFHEHFKDEPRYKEMLTDPEYIAIVEAIEKNKKSRPDHWKHTLLQLLPEDEQREARRLSHELHVLEIELQRIRHAWGLVVKPPAETFDKWLGRQIALLTWQGSPMPDDDIKAIVDDASTKAKTFARERGLADIPVHYGNDLRYLRTLKAWAKNAPDEMLLIPELRQLFVYGKPILLTKEECDLFTAFVRYKGTMDTEQLSTEVANGRNKLKRFAERHPDIANKFIAFPGKGKRIYRVRIRLKQSLRPT